MKNIIFFDVDTQYDFMHRDGKLYVPDAEKIIPNLKKITLLAKEKGISVIASIDEHEGQKKIPETILSNITHVPNKKLSGYKLKNFLENHSRFWIYKQNHDAFSNPNLRLILNGTKRAYVYGVATDYCVKAVVLGLRNVGVETFVIIDAIKSINKKNEKRDFALFSREGAKFLTTKQLLGKNEI